MALRLARPFHFNLNKNAYISLSASRNLAPRLLSTQASSAQHTSNPTSVNTQPDKLNGSTHWVIERALSVSLVPLFGAAFVYGSHPHTNMALGFVLPLHCHIGFDAIITDYLPARKFPKANLLCTWLLRLLTGLTMYGCYKINTSDVGLIEATKKIWTQNSA
jgi:succinate dehydrogenase (ubiquinone) membrane anchor subunit